MSSRTDVRDLKQITIYLLQDFSPLKNMVRNDNKRLFPCASTPLRLLFIFFSPQRRRGAECSFFLSSRTKVRDLKLSAIYRSLDFSPWKTWLEMTINDCFSVPPRLSGDCPFFYKPQRTQSSRRVFFHCALEPMPCRHPAGRSDSITILNTNDVFSASSAVNNHPVISIKCEISLCLKWVHR